MKNTKLCHVCGEKHPSPKLSERKWVCLGCGTDHSRDENAAITFWLKYKLLSVRQEATPVERVKTCNDSAYAGCLAEAGSPTALALGSSRQQVLKSHPMGLAEAEARSRQDPMSLTLQLGNQLWGK